MSISVDANNVETYRLLEDQPLKLFELCQQVSPWLIGVGAITEGALCLERSGYQIRLTIAPFKRPQKVEAVMIQTRSQVLAGSHKLEHACHSWGGL